MMLTLPVKIVLRFSGMLLLASVFRLAPAHADPATYIDGQYILKTSPSRLLTKKNVEELQNYSNEPLVIDLIQEHITVVTTLTGSENNNYTQNPTRDVCLKFRRGKRMKLRASRGDTSARRFISCEKDQLYFVTRTPNDTYYYLQWGANNTTEGYDMRLQSAWDKSTGSRSVVVGIIDTGVDYTHPDLQANMWRNPGEIAGNGIDDDGNGVVDDVYGYNAITNSGNPMDDAGHGTHVAGTIGGLGDNATGVTGVNWQVQMVAIKFLGANGSGSLSDAIKGIDYATNLKLRGINIIGTNNSWGGGAPSQAGFDAIERANSAGLFFVAAAGNSATNIDQSPSYPAAYQNTNIISVAALNRNGSIASFSNYGAQNVDVAAPGVSIASTYPGNGYVYMDGTSMAAPHVTGLLALAKAFSPQSTLANLKSALFSTVTNIAGLNGLMKYPGLVNANAMLTQLQVNPPPTSTPQATPTNTVVPTPSATPTPQATPTMTPTPRPGYFSAGITVRDSQGVPLSGAFIELRCADGSSYFATSGDNGSAMISRVLGPVNFTLITKKAGHIFANQPGRITSDTSLSVQASSGQLYPLSVHVLTKQQLPVSGATIDLGSLGTLTTGSSGTASIMVPVGTVYSLSVDVPTGELTTSFATGEILGATTRLFISDDS